MEPLDRDRGVSLVVRSASSIGSIAGSHKLGLSSVACGQHLAFEIRVRAIPSLPCQMETRVLSNHSVQLLLKRRPPKSEKTVSVLRLSNSTFKQQN
jgi:hypothetical protein